MLFGVIVQGIFGYTVFGVNYATFLLFTVIIYLFTQTLVMFFFVGTGVSVKEYTEEHKLDQKFRKKMYALKMRLYPPLMNNLMLMMAAGISVGAAFADKIPFWVHLVFLGLCTLHFLKIIRIEHESFRENTAIILDMS